MRILFVCQAFLPHFEGGTERVARVHAKALVEAGHEVAIVAAAPVGSLAKDKVDDLSVTFVEESLCGTDPLAEQLLIERPKRRDAVLVVARDFRPDVVHIQHHASLSLGLTPGLSKLGARVFISLHDMFVTCPRFFRDPPEGLDCPPPGEFETCAQCLATEAPAYAPEDLERALIERALGMRLELEAAWGLFAPSASHAERIEKLVGLDPGCIEVLPNGLTEAFEQRPKAAPPAAIDEPLQILFFGHRTKTKGVIELVQAASAAARLSARPISLTMLGAPLEAGIDVQLKRLAAPLHLSLEGPFDRARLTAAASQAHVAVFPSKALESYGLVVDEALALGLPVFVADAGALGERIGGAGRILPRPINASAVDAWTAAFVELAQDPTCIEAWRAQIPDRMLGPNEVAAMLIEHYSTQSKT